MAIEPFKLSVNNGQYQFEVQPEDARGLDLIADGPNAYHLLMDGKAYHATLLESDGPERHYVIEVNGRRFSVDIADRYQQLVQQLGLSVGGHQKVNVIKAPMPGLVLSISAEPGMEVQKGDPLLILEAMKMENVIKAVDAGVVKAIHVQKGAAVDKGQLLVEME